MTIIKLKLLLEIIQLRPNKWDLLNRNHHLKQNICVQTNTNYQIEIITWNYTSVCRQIPIIK